MKNCITILLLLIVLPGICIVKDSLRKDSIDYYWSVASQDTSRVLLLVDHVNYYKFPKPDSALFYRYKELALARQINFAKGEARAMMHIAIGYSVF